jgi:hypothetical protein
MFFDENAPPSVHRYTEKPPTLGASATACSQWTSLCTRFVLLSTSVIVTLQAGTLTLGAYYTQQRLQASFEDKVFIVQALHVVLVPLLLYMPLAWCLSLSLPRSLCVSRLLVLGTVLLSCSLLAAGIAGVASHGNALHAEEHFGVVVWRSEGVWTMAGTELRLLSPLLLALYTSAVGISIWWRTGMRTTAVAQLLLLVGHFVVSVNDTAAFFLPSVWQTLFILSLLHTDWALWRQQDKAAAEQMQAQEQSGHASYAALLASHDDTRLHYTGRGGPAGFASPGDGFSSPGAYAAQAYGLSATPTGSLQWNSPRTGQAMSPGTREMVY